MSEMNLSQDMKHENISRAKKKTSIVKYIFLMLVIGILVLVLFFLPGCSSSSKFEKDFKEIIHLTFDSNMQDVIDFEKTTYGNVEYEQYDYGGKQSNKPDVLGFDSYIKGTEVEYKHNYFFDKDTKKLVSIMFETITDFDCRDGSNVCDHVEELKQLLLDTYSDWDKIEKDSEACIMYGNIDGVECKIRYNDYNGIKDYIHITSDID